jgi:ATP-dependent DNA helicase RecQ
MPAPPQTENLAELVHRVFGHREFRAHQQVVCEAATAGRDVLLVMPTGAGKSLCYQLPALARGGTALVISPLIALMDDQAMKLSALGLRVARVHSGLSREDARQACRDYLAGELDFLFIAPERMRVPGFPEMLAKRKPALVAIDEAHCISAWGHDFRPDYRTLGQHLPALRPAPIIALTATATPTVQRDIAVQLDLKNPAVFITGFRRENLAVQAVELSKPQRAEFTAKLLADADARPAIVYASSRKSAEEIATRLNRDFSARAYHAGLESSVRERVQREFLAGKIDVVVATIAFGMGVDKADVRTVVHVALPGSVEAFYQEIGRAGRDGLESRTVLMYNFGDRKMQEFFLEKNYPAISDVDRVARALNGEFAPVEYLQRRLKMDSETLDRSLEKLIGAGVATMDMNGDVRATEPQSGRAGENSWKTGYEAQVDARRAQIDRMVAFAEGHTCRMTALVQHFGDTTDRRGPCGRCDVCRPESGVGGAEAHVPDASERESLRAILKAIEGRGQSTGKLFTELKICKERNQFDSLLDGLARAGLLSIGNESFVGSEGNEITFRKVTITHEGRSPDDATLGTVWIRGEVAKGGKAKKKRAVQDRVAQDEESPLTPAAEALEKRLRLWRSEQAKSSGKPAYVILHDKTLRALAGAAPRNVADLLRVAGMGEAKADQIGEAILAICREPSMRVSPGPELVRTSAPAILAARERRVEADVASRSIARTTSAVSAVQQSKRPSVPSVLVELSQAQIALEEKLKLWRREEARNAGLPSFFIFSDAALRNIVLAEPVSIAELRAVRGVAPEKLEKFGTTVLEMCRG